MKQLDTDHWIERWVFPVVNALAARDAAKVAEAEQAIRDAIAAHAVDADTTAALHYILGYYIYVRPLIMGATDRLPACLDEALAVLAQPPAGPISSREQRCLLLQLRIIADDAGTRPLLRSEYDKLRQTLTPEELHTEQWFYISKYTFKQRDLAGTAAAYEQYLERSSYWARDYNWRRLEVMVKLLEKRATRLDLELLIKSLVVPGCITEMERVILPEARRIGLVDDNLQALLDQRRAELEDRLLDC